MHIVVDMHTLRQYTMHLLRKERTMSKRKTINVAEVRYTVNNILKDSAYDDDRHQQWRMGMILLLEDILHKTKSEEHTSELQSH